MHKGDKQGEDRQDKIPEEIKQNNVDKLLMEIQSLRSSVEILKKNVGVGDSAAQTISRDADTRPPAVDASFRQVSTPVVEPVMEPAADPVAEAFVNEETAPREVSADAAAVPRQAQTHDQTYVEPAVEPAPRQAAADPAPASGQPGAQTAVVTDSQDETQTPVQGADPADIADRPVGRFSRKEAARRERALRVERRAEQKRRKKEEEEARKRERRQRTKELQKKREIRAEVRRRKKLADKSAEYGGGVVQFHDTEISTEIQPVARYSILDLLGLSHRQKIKAAETEEEKRSLQKEQEIVAADARQAASHLSKVRASQFRNSAPGKVIASIKEYSEKHKKILLFTLGFALLVVVGIAGFFNYYTLYEYSYNGHALGYVKNKDDVLRITDMVQKALTTDKDMEVVIDENDITFRNVSAMDRDIAPDSSDQVLRRLTYMGDLNVKAWGMYVNGKKMGAVQKKAYAADVLKKLEDRYFSGKEGAVIEKAEIQEKIEVRRSNTDLRNVVSSDKMVDKLCSTDERILVHTIVAGETLEDITAQYKVSEDDLLLENEGVDPKNLKAGNTLLVKQTAPPVTVRITEKRTYDQKIKYKTEEKKTDEMYEGETEVKQEGKNGKEEVTERTVSINGEINEDDRTILDRKVLKKAVTKIVIVGTAERPPSVGDGVYIWPIESGYSLTSRYGRRWGRLHAGIDLGTRTGNDVLAADGGIVTRAGYYGGYGLCVDIDHQNGQSTRYGHLSQSLVDVGDEVYEGQHIAESGNSGRSTGPHLHFEIHINGSAVDPLPYLP